ncbi:uncharacterized protein N7529_009306 [Penicillium soppii]|jgi:quercetin dioxygenase-like cupin family protein|uniref:uncharacterized protein n=1 Tax=Penicillium soppii TaxID=69789 RepID=UPI0025496560|nr:uncharacterized protein N7529_009306 [Penicillium soppii]KAJ5855362.1 hypothetical protein N7529_009306 [Penicillium soppii]
MPSNRNSGSSSSLPPVIHYVTGNDPSTSKAIVVREMPGSWKTHDDLGLAIDLVYTTKIFPPDLRDGTDITDHEDAISRGDVGLISPSGTVCRIVDFMPGNECIMHVTQSLDYGVVLDGEIEMRLDSGETKLLNKGDTVVQRATMHGWKNKSDTEWARMFFVLQDCPEGLGIQAKQSGQDH